jgi:hypothetical protein
MLPPLSGAPDTAEFSAKEIVAGADLLPCVGDCPRVGRMSVRDKLAFGGGQSDGNADQGSG